MSNRGQPQKEFAAHVKIRKPINGVDREHTSNSNLPAQRRGLPMGVSSKKKRNEIFKKLTINRMNT